MRRLTMFIALFALLVTSLRTSTSAYGQAGSDGPPRVISSTPAPYEEIPPETPLEITFDQPMDKASVIAALSISPTIKPAANWKDDRTLAVVAADFKRDIQYTLTIGTTAKSVTGVALGATYKLPFNVAGQLKIAQVIPAPNSKEVQPSTSITVVFNRPVVPLVDTSSQSSLPQPLTFTPVIAGKGEWVSTAIYVFKPDTALAGGTEYTATVDAKLTDTTGGALGAAFSWTFATASPQLLSISPNSGQSQVPLDSTIQLYFNQPMDRPSTEKAVAVFDGDGKPVKGTFTWTDGDRSFGFKPAERLSLAMTYRFAITADALSASGGARLSNPLAINFTTLPYPAFVNANPFDGQQDAYPGGGVTLNYNTLMDQKSFAEKVHVTPEPSNFSLYGYGQSIQLNFSTAPVTEYTVTIDAGVMDIYGNAVKEPTIIRFKTRNLEPYLYVPTKDSISLTNGYLPETALYAVTTGVTEIQAQVFALNTQEFTRLGNDPYNFNGGTSVRIFTIPVAGDPNKQITTKIALADQGGALKPGFYLVRVGAKELQSRNGYRPQQIGLVVGTANLTMKRAMKDVLVWATDLKTGLPLPNAGIDVYQSNSVLVGRAVTGPDGLARIALDSANVGNVSAILQSSEAVPQFGFVGAYGGLDPYQYGVSQSTYAPPIVNTVYTDQPIYRPGRPVYFKGILRAIDDVTYTVPAGTVTVNLVSPDGQNVYTKDLPLSEFGTYNGQYELPLGATLGNFVFQVTYRGTQYGGQSFQVAEYRVPEFQVNATAAAPDYVKDAKIKVEVDSKFFFGGPVSGAQLTWNALANPSYFNYTGDGEWSFGVNDPYYWYYSDFYYGRGYGGQNVASGSGVTDADGKFTIEVPATWAQSNPASFTIEATVTDISNQPISGRTTVTVHPADLYVGLRAETTLAQTDKPVTVKMIAVDWKSKPLAGTTIKSSVILRRYQQDPKTLEYKTVDDEIAADSVTTGADGQTQITFTPKEAGLYRIYGRAQDKSERLAESVTYVWVSGPQPFADDQNDKSLRLVSDKRAYVPGDTAEILIPSPFAGKVQALVSLERAGIIKQEVITVEGGTPYKLPITEDFAPNVYISVTIVKGMDSPTAAPDFRSGVLQLKVQVKQQMTVKLAPNVATAKPGDKIKIDVLTTDLTGEPVTASVGLKMTDLANLSLSTDDGPNLFQAFWYDRSLAVITSISLNALIDTIKPADAQRVDQVADGMINNNAVGGAAESGAAPPALAAAPTATARAADKATDAPTVAPRTNFVDTPLWEPEVVTGPDGRASVEVTLPDNLTTWRIDGRGISKATYLGQSTTDIVSTKPLLVRPATPRFFIVGDEAELATVVNNNTGADQSVNVRLDVKGAELIKGQSQITVMIPSKGRARIAWTVKVGQGDSVDATFTAVAGEFQDAAKPDVGIGDARLLPVYQYVAPDYVSTAGALTAAGTRTELIRLPTGPTAPTSGELTVRLNTSLAAVTLDGLTYLRNYPYQCTEQTVSKFLPNVITFRALQKLGQDSPELKQNLLTAIAEAEARLKATQHSDGGWGWYVRDESSPLTSAYALLGLLEAHNSDLLTDKDVFQRGLTFLLGQRRGVSMNTPVYDLHTLVFVEYVLARAGNINTFSLDDLFVQRERMNLFARAFLAQAYALAPQPDQGKITVLLNDLINAGILSASGLHFEEQQQDWWNWDSNTRTTAIVLDTLVQLQPNSPLIPNIIRWLVVARRSDAWETTQETAWSVMALTDWMVASNELKANYPYTVALDGSQLNQGTAGPENLKVTQTLTISIAELLKAQASRLSVNRGDGDGALYYTASLHLEQPVEAITPTSRGISLTRQYFIDGKSVTQAKVGDTITVKLDINVPHDLYFVVINDPIPAGTEMLDTSLRTTTQIGQPPQLDLIDPDYGWGWWWWSETQLRTEKAVLTSRYLPAGTYRYVYQIRATAPGIYRVIPPNGNEFYFPEVFGRGAGSLFTITPQ